MNKVVVSLVTRDEESVLEDCLDSLERQSIAPRIEVFDNASGDATTAIARRRGVSLTASPENLGYAAGHNRIAGQTDAPYLLFLNADARLHPAFIERLLETMECRPDCGMAGGKLLRMAQGAPVFQGRHPVLDSTGIYFTPEQRHFDRGSGQPDKGQYQRVQRVFGITGAALLCRRAMLEDIAPDGRFFDEDFFAYREDADLAWRARLRGWEAIYEPSAWGWHRRTVTHRGRRHHEAAVNFHSWKNRFLMRIKNMDSAVRGVCTPWMQIRDAGILTYATLLERNSLPAYREVSRLRDRMEEKRRFIQHNRRVGGREMARWFSFQPRAFDV